MPSRCRRSATGTPSKGCRSVTGWGDVQDRVRYYQKIFLAQDRLAESYLGSGMAGNEQEAKRMADTYLAGKSGADMDSNSSTPIHTRWPQTMINVRSSSFSTPAANSLLTRATKEMRRRNSVPSPCSRQSDSCGRGRRISSHSE
jgi:hypothetical protein